MTTFWPFFHLLKKNTSRSESIFGLSFSISLCQSTLPPVEMFFIGLHLAVKYVKWILSFPSRSGDRNVQVMGHLACGSSDSAHGHEASVALGSRGIWHFPHARKERSGSVGCFSHASAGRCSSSGFRGKPSQQASSPCFPILVASTFHVSGCGFEPGTRACLAQPFILACHLLSRQLARSLQLGLATHA